MTCHVYPFCPNYQTTSRWSVRYPLPESHAFTLQVWRIGNTWKPCRSDMLENHYRNTTALPKDTLTCNMHKHRLSILLSGSKRFPKQVTFYGVFCPVYAHIEQSTTMEVMASANVPSPSLTVRQCRVRVYVPVTKHDCNCHTAITSQRTQVF